MWGYLEINSAKTLGPNHWHRDDPGAVFHPDNVLISSRKANTIGLIDRSSGRIVWRLGPYFEADPGAEHHGSTAIVCRARSTRFPVSITRTSSPTGFPAQGNCSCSTTKAVRIIRLLPLGFTRVHACWRSTRSPST